MAQIAKIEAKTEIKCAPAKIFDFFKYNLTGLVNMCPQIFKSAKIVEGEQGQPGNVVIFDYVIGKPMTCKVMIEEIDDEKKSINFKVLEGEVMQLYSTYKANMTANDGCVKWCLEFEKANESAPNPDEHAQVAVEVTKSMDLYFLNH